MFLVLGKHHIGMPAYLFFHLSVSSYIKHGQRTLSGDQAEGKGRGMLRMAVVRYDTGASSSSGKRNEMRTPVGQQDESEDGLKLWAWRRPQQSKQQEDEEERWFLSAVVAALVSLSEWWFEEVLRAWAYQPRIREVQQLMRPCETGTWRLYQSEGCAVVSLNKVIETPSISFASSLLAFQFPSCNFQTIYLFTDMDRSIKALQ